MGGVLHGCARSTPRVRAELQASQDSTRASGRRYRLNPKTVAKWRARTTTADAPMWPRARRSRLLTAQRRSNTPVFSRGKLSSTSAIC
jgi:hypothetical protein